MIEGIICKKLQQAEELGKLRKESLCDESSAANEFFY
jgi:hypothetical protein